MIPLKWDKWDINVQAHQYYGIIIIKDNLFFFQYNDWYDFTDGEEDIVYPSHVEILQNEAKRQRTMEGDINPNHDTLEGSISDDDGVFEEERNMDRGSEEISDEHHDDVPPEASEQDLTDNNSENEEVEEVTFF